MICRETFVEQREEKHRKRGEAFINLLYVRDLTVMTVKKSILGYPTAMRM
jgi:hypothetical protein